MFYSVTLTMYEENPSLSRYNIYMIENGQFLYNEKVSYETAMRFLRLLEKKTGRAAVLEVNPYDRTIYTKSIHYYE